MWLVTTMIGAILATVLYFAMRNPRREKYKIHWLVLMLWGATIMITIDHVVGYEGGDFLEVETDGLIASGVLLGLLMYIPVIVVWIIGVLISNKRKT